MSKLTAARRRALPSSAFAVPSRRAYPVMDAGHRKAALGEVAAHGTPREQRQVRTAVAQRRGTNTGGRHHDGGHMADGFKSRERHMGKRV